MSTPRLRVLQVGKFYAPYRGGMETYLKDLCDGLRHAVDVEVLVANTTRETVHETVDGIPVTTIGLDGAISRIRGQVGTTVQIGLKRGDQVLQLVVERKKFHA